MRGRLYRDYILDLKEKLNRACEEAIHEKYVPIPIKFVDGSLFIRQEGVVDFSAHDIVNRLTLLPAKQRITITIESDGGRGKSALIREVQRSAINRFEKNDHFPIPIILPINVEGIQDLKELVKQSFSSHVISDDIFEDELKTGKFLLILDGLTESRIKPEIIEKYVKSEAGMVSPMLVGKRHDLKFNESLQRSSSRWMKVEPARLDEESYRIFVDTYKETDLKNDSSRKSKELTPKLKNICKTKDGTYLPILVRLCLIADETVKDIKDMYESAFKTLLKDDKKVELFEYAGNLCVNTYWKNGYRILSCAAIPGEMRENLNLLINSQILIPTMRNTFNNEPQEVAFFHDSMQSFLTAAGLIRLPDAWDHLARAAGDPLFAKGQSEFKGETGSELFQMCLMNYGSGEQLSDRLRSDLNDWAGKLRDDFSLREIKSAIPPGVTEKMKLIMDDPSPETLLKSLTEACQNEVVEQEIADLAFVYAHIAPLVWKAGH